MQSDSAIDRLVVVPSTVTDDVRVAVVCNRDLTCLSHCKPLVCEQE